MKVGFAIVGPSRTCQQRLYIGRGGEKGGWISADAATAKPSGFTIVGPARTRHQRAGRRRRI
jgi:hypothetical protein